MGHLGKHYTLRNALQPCAAIMSQHIMHDGYVRVSIESHHVTAYNIEVGSNLSSTNTFFRKIDFRWSVHPRVGFFCRL